MDEKTVDEKTLDETKMAQFVERAVGDVGALLGGAMVVIGDKLGLYRAMAGAGPLSPAELAARTGTVERYVREWSSAQAARGYASVSIAPVSVSRASSPRSASHTRSRPSASSSRPSGRPPVCPTRRMRAPPRSIAKTEPSSVPV